MSLTRQLAVSFLGFVIAGSIALVVWIRHEAQRESRRQFVHVAEANARFIREAVLPRTERTSAGLRQALGVDVLLVRQAEAAQWPQPGEWQSFDDGREAAAATIAGDERLVLIRAAPPFVLMADPARFFAALLGFWALSLALAWVLARRIVHPLRSLAERLPHIAEEGSDPALPEAARRDEIGQLARAYTETRAQLTSERAKRTQAERLAALGKMATGLAHEINNPVAAIRLHAQLLEEELSGEQLERAQTILGESSRIESLVSQWMFVARPQPPQTSPCDLAEIVSAVARTLTPAAAHAEVAIRNETAAGLWVSADQRRMIQAVTNVLINAIQAAAGGEVVIGARVADPNVELSFSDSGRGFSPAALEHGSELFFSEKEGGMGVGLSVTAEILRAHGGELRLANKPGGGATVTLVLPGLKGM